MWEHNYCNVIKKEQGSGKVRLFLKEQLLISSKAVPLVTRRSRLSFLKFLREKKSYLNTLAMSRDRRKTDNKKWFQSRLSWQASWYLKEIPGSMACSGRHRSIDNRPWLVNAWTKQGASCLCARRRGTHVCRSPTIASVCHVSCLICLSNQTKSEETWTNSSDRVFKTAVSYQLHHSFLSVCLCVCVCSVMGCGLVFV